MKKFVFLGGTAANNNWRESFTEALAVHGLGEHLFNPVVKDWNEEKRYETSGLKGKALYEAVAGADGVLQWIKQRW